MHLRIYMSLFHCVICQKKRPLFKALCRACQTLFGVVQKSKGEVGFSQLMDELIATEISRDHIKVFLQSDPHGKGSILDQITAQLTNDLAQGMGVKDKDMTPDDVRRIRNTPSSGVSTKPIES